MKRTMGALQLSVMIGALASLASMTGGAAAAQAAALRFTGKVVYADPERVVVREGRNIFTVTREEGPKIPENLQVGDYITIEYEAEPKRVAPARETEQPGQVPPSGTPEMRDDRLFYPA